MTFDLSGPLERRLSDLARQQGREVRTLVEDAIDRYLVDAATTDLTPAQVAATQERLLPELSGLTPWPPESPGDDAQ